MKKVTISFLIILMFSFAFGGFFYFKVQETVEKTVLGVKNVRLQNEKIKDKQDVLPATDVSGEDLLNLARFPNAVRTVFLKKEIATMTSYQVEAPSTDVLSFYETQMINNHWGVAQKSLNRIIFVREDQKATFLANTNSFGITTFQIILENF